MVARYPAAIAFEKSGIPTETKKTLQIEVERHDSSEKGRILRVLAEKGYNQKEAAKELGINRSTLYRKLKSLNIKVNKNCII